MPISTNVLITHGPPFGILDQVPQGPAMVRHCGSQELLRVVKKLNQLDLRAHIFGHIHEAYGSHGYNYATQCSNVSACNERYEIVNKPIIIEI